MEYLKKNLDNSLILPYDIMRTIYEYADCFVSIRKQIDNKEYNLDEIMYKRMKKYIETRFTNSFQWYQVSHPTTYNSFFITPENIDNIEIRDKLLNWKHGYKDFYLWKSINPQTLCGIEMHYSPHYLTSQYFKSRMIEHLKLTNNEQSYIRYDIKSLSQIYKLWIRI